MRADERTALREELAQIAERSRGQLRRSRVANTCAEFCGDAALLYAMVGPFSVLMALAVGRALGVAVNAPSLGTLIFVSLMTPTMMLILRIVVTARAPISDLEALAAFDEHLRTKHSLVAARELLDANAESPFVTAALEDSRFHANRARGAQLEKRVKRPMWGSQTAGLVVIVLLLLLAPLLFDDIVRRPSGVTPDHAAAPGLGSVADEVRDQKPKPRETVTNPKNPEPEVRPPTSEPPTPTGEQTQRSGELSKELKKTRGKTTFGTAANAASASGASDARGTPSKQGQASQPPKKPAKPKKKKKPKKRPPRDDEPDKNEKPRTESGATAGRGAASGSTKSPAASIWSSKDQVVSDDEEDLEEDEPVDDEFDDSDARGGLQPQLRDRKPPVNRDLTIGFGNQKNPDANGRGGASEQKKSRGVASLVLGVPIPDHVKGRPNPGKTKITQERIEPRAEDAPPIAASEQTARNQPVGHLSRYPLEPWMRDLLTQYFLELRKTTGGSATAPTTDDSQQ